MYYDESIHCTKFVWICSLFFLLCYLMIKFWFIHQFKWTKILLGNCFIYSTLYHLLLFIFFCSSKLRSYLATPSTVLYLFNYLMIKSWFIYQSYLATPSTVISSRSGLKVAATLISDCYCYWRLPPPWYQIVMNRRYCYCYCYCYYCYWRLPPPWYQIVRERSIKVWRGLIITFAQCNRLFELCC